MEVSPVQIEEDGEHKETMDPLVKVPDAFDEILKYLTGKELLTAMLVSKGWMEFIESHSKLINQAMDGVIFCPESRVLKLSLLDGSFDKNLTKRPYKHMRGTLNLIFHPEGKVEFELAHYYPGTLETLEIRGSAHASRDSKFLIPFFARYDVKDFEFAKLKKLRCWDYDDLKWFSYPEVTHLQVHGGYLEASVANAAGETLCKFPKLTCLILYCDYLDELDEDNGNIENYEFDPLQPKIQQMMTTIFLPKLMKQHQNSLQVFETDKANLKELSWMLRNLKQLRSLTINHLCFADNDEEFSYQNNSVEVLKIMWTSDNPGNRWDRARSLLQLIFLAVPSLKTLYLEFAIIKPETLQFLGK